MKSRKFWLAGIVASTLVFAACGKDPLSDLSQNESKIYITDYDSSVRFSNYNTFSISDSVAVISDGRVSRAQTAVDIATINAVKSALLARGYQLVAKDNAPDLGITVNRIYNTSTGIIDYGSYYDSYYGSYWDPYYWGYGGYGYYTPYSYATYSIKEGAIGVDVLDLKNAAANNKIDVIWTGLIRGSGIFDPSSSEQQVKALFDQSAYLSK